MTNTVGNVVAGKPLTTGGVLYGALTATLPTTATASLTGFTALGYAGDAGLVESPSRTTQTVKAWGGDVIKVLQTDFTATFQFTLVETLNSDANKVVYGSANVAVTAPNVSHGNLLAIAVNSATLDKNAWIFDMKDGLVRVRFVIPIGQPITIGDVTYSDGGTASFPVTLQAFPDASGNVAYKYTDDGLHT